MRPDLQRIRSLTGTIMPRTKFGRLNVMKGSDQAPAVKATQRWQPRR